MNAKRHYDEHLGDFYSWMIGDLEQKQNEFLRFLERTKVSPISLQSKAIDLGAGNGVQSIPLAKLGFKVTAVDFNDQLLTELRSNSAKYDIEIRMDDIKNVKSFAPQDLELVLCCGDTIAHLNSFIEIEQLLYDVYSVLNTGGKFILSFRDYTETPSYNDRFIPVKSDEEKILTCILQYEDEHVIVTDQLYKKNGHSWDQKVSSYKKVRIGQQLIEGYLTEIGYSINYSIEEKGFVKILAEKS